MRLSGDFACEKINDPGLIIGTKEYMMVVVVYVLMVPQGLLIITLIIIINVATTPPDKDVSMLMYLMPLLKTSSTKF